MTGFIELTEKDITVHCDDNPEYADRAVNLIVTDEYEGTKIANCMSVLVRLADSVADAFLAGQQMTEENGVMKARFDGVFVDFPKNVTMTTHTIRPDLVLFFFERN